MASFFLLRFSEAITLFFFFVDGLCDTRFCYRFHFTNLFFFWVSRDNSVYVSVSFFFSSVPQFFSLLSFCCQFLKKHFTEKGVFFIT